MTKVKIANEQPLDIYMRYYTFFSNLANSVIVGGHLHSIISHMYSVPKRYYHNLSHIKQCLMELDVLCADSGWYGQDELETALWFHDIVYSPYGHTNEKDSAKFARIMLSSIGCNARLFTDIVTKMIIATDLTLNPFELTEYGKIIRDIDISNLGYDWDTFKQNSRNISYEYPGTDTAEFRKRRKEFLKNTFLSRERIYYTDYFYNRYEDKARDNLERLIYE